MPDHRKRPRYPNQLSKLIFDIGQKENPNTRMTAT
jgi:hypothetical protein